MLDCLIDVFPLQQAAARGKWKECFTDQVRENGVCDGVCDDKSAT